MRCRRAHYQQAEGGCYRGGTIFAWQRFDGSRASKLKQDATADSLWQQGGRSEARCPLWLRGMVCSAWNRSFCIRRTGVAALDGGTKTAPTCSPSMTRAPKYVGLKGNVVEVVVLQA